MRLSTKAIAACALLSFSPLSSAAVYLGATGTMSEFSKYDDVKRGFGSQIFAGYRGETVPLMFEVAYLTTGDNDVDGLDVALSFKGQAASVGYYGKMNNNGSGFFAKVGYYTGDSKLKDTSGGGSIEETSSGATYAFGVDWMVARNFGFRFDIGGLINVKDLPGLDSGHKSNVTLINLGVVFAFGGSEPKPRYQPAPVYTPAVPVPAPAPAPEVDPAVYAPAAPAPAPAPQVYAPEALSYTTEPVVTRVVAPAPTPSPVAKGSAQLVPGAVLRSGPTMKSAAIRTLPDGGSVKLLNREANAEGPWWSVQLEDGSTGWMIEWGLTRISKR